MIKKILSKVSSCLPMRYQEALAVMYGMLYPPEKDTNKAFHLLTLARNRLLPEYPLDWAELEWCESPGFREYLKSFDELHGHNSSRRWMLGQLLRLTDSVPGDTCECGVYRGASSWLICQRNAKNHQHERVHHVFDSFEGLSDPDPAKKDDTEHWKKGALAAGEEIVAENLSGTSPFRLYKGWIPTQFSKIEEQTFSFVHVDVDLYQPTKDSIEFFYPRMNSGAVFLCDDYFCTKCVGATKACDEYLLDKQEKMVPLSSGGGFFIKGVPTGENLYHNQD